MEIMPVNHRAKWTNKEFKQLLKEIRNNMDINEIANVHMRTVGAIKYKLIRYAIERNEENPNLSLKNLAEITNLSVEDLKNGFGGNLYKGYFKAPATARYRFYISCDDECQIQFSN